jgi:hypothetical protein
MFTTEHDTDTGWHITRAVRTDQSIDVFVLTASDVLSNYKTALDYVAYQLFIASGGDPESRGAEKIYYPIAATAEAWSAQRSGLIKGVNDALADHVKATQPCYRSDPGVRPLLDLAFFTRPDKHRELLSMGMLTGAKIKLVFEVPDDLPTGAEIEQFASEGVRPIENAELYRWRIMRNGVPQTMAMLFGGETKVPVNYDVAFEISLSYGDRVCAPFSEIGEEVRRIIEQFEIILNP